MHKDPTRLPPLDLLASFEAAARLLSFTRAGGERFITQSAMSRQIRALEDELGVALFRRSHRALALTADGERLYAACATMLAQLREVVAQIRTPARREVLALSTTPGLASLWLIPRLPLFTKTHPGIDVRLDASLARRDLRAEGFHIAIRYGRVGASEGTPFFSEAMQPVCSPKLLRRGSGAPPLRTPADLRAHTLLQVESPQRPSMPLEWDLWLQAVGLPELQPASTSSFSGYDAAIAAALAGQGVALGRRPLVDALLKSRQLVAPFKDTMASPWGYFLVVEPGARSKPAVRALESWLLEQAALER
jgi:LysR family glycine cleavage system transcriptional activator